MIFTTSNTKKLSRAIQSINCCILTELVEKLLSGMRRSRIDRILPGFCPTMKSDLLTRLEEDVVVVPIITIRAHDNDDWLKEECERMTKALRPNLELIDYVAILDNKFSLRLRHTLEALDLHFSSKLRNALSSTPSQAEVLHGATCRSILCSFVI